MTRLERLEREIYYTYHDKKNKDLLPVILFLSCLFIILKGAILYEIALWGCYFYYCMENNKKLNKDIHNIEKRAKLIILRNKIISNKENI